MNYGSLKRTDAAWSADSFPRLFVFVLAGSLFPGCLPLAAEDLPVLHTAREVRRLTPEEAERHYPVRLSGVLTFFEQRTPNRVFRFVQDDTAGIYFDLGAAAGNPSLRTGQRVEIEGQSGKGEFAPTVSAQRIRILGDAPFPIAKPVSFEQLSSGQEDSQFVEVRGIARSVQPDFPTNYYSIEIATGEGRLTAYANELPVPDGQELADTLITVRAVCVTQFNLRRQLFDVRLIIPRREDLIVEQSAPRKDPFAIPAQSIGSLLQFAPKGAYGRRVKVAGTVICRQNDNALYVQDETEGLYAETRQYTRLQPGDRVEVLGFPARGEYTPMLQDAVFRKITSGPPPAPDSVSADEALRGTHDCRLVRINATVLDRSHRRNEEFLVLQTGGLILQASLERPGRGADFSDLRNGSKVAVTGVCLIDKGSDWFAGGEWRAKSFRLLLRSPADVLVLERPPWWTLRKLLWALGVLELLVTGALVWIAVLRRRVHKQTRIIRQQLQTEAALKDRYEDLFENANDMVFTHDLGGRITSINKAGERLLQRRRGDIISKNLVDLVAEEQRVDARQWLDQITNGVELPAVEWDFVDAGGHRSKLEISTRIVDQGGKHVEVEGIARDITERKHLEREILEVSTREQRRIGHDLHDGVCQHLAGIAYRVDILSDQLQGKGIVECAELERIGRFINEVITQTRRVARGLSPARLAEDGLESAVQELAVQASSLFNITCRFSCHDALPPMEDSMLLHLYYIVQEAVSNAAKHGKAAVVNISLRRVGDRFVLSIQDGGRGFPLPAPAASGMGIRIMRYRARCISATLDLKSELGQGTKVTCSFYAASKTDGQRTPDDDRTPQGIGTIRP